VSSPFPPAQQAAYIKLFNRFGRQLEKAGICKPDLSPDRLIQQARRRTGLHNFGDESFRMGLEVLTTALRDQAQLSQIGRMAAHFNILENLCVRLQLVDFRARHPEIAEQQIKQPLFITGLPRTGTTILFELIAQDPAMRSPASWEVAKPIPPAKRTSYDNDKRIRSVDRFMALAEKLSPGFQAIHAIGARLPQECVYTFASQFVSEQFSYMYNIPHYRAWALNQDMTATYRWHATFLQHMQVDFGTQQWVLKTPSHLAYLKYLFAQYPDAAIVWTHRRPLDAIASFSSLTTTLQNGFSDTVDRKVIGAQEFEHFSKTVQMGIEQRRTLDQSRFFDVSFSAICTNPIAVIRDLYDYFGWSLSDEAESNMREYLKRRPRNLYGEHQYSASDFGLDGQQESSLYSGYLSQFYKYLD
jgi:hypothetical protein